MSFAKRFFQNASRPEGFLGRLMLNGMNLGHAKVTAWGLSLLEGLAPQTVLDCGCGGGRFLNLMLKKHPNAKGCGLDYSEASVKKATQVNRAFIREDRCRIVQGDIRNFPFDDNSFDLITAFETVYFWPDIAKCFEGVYKALRSGGTFLVVNEINGKDKSGQMWKDLVDGLELYTGDQLQGYMRKAGFADLNIKVFEKDSWLAVIAKKL